MILRLFIKIEFYEEFPNEENLSKLKLIKFPTKIFIAAKSVNEFKKIWENCKILQEKFGCSVLADCEKLLLDFPFFKYSRFGWTL